VEPTRGDGGHRLYSDRDIERLRLLHAATRAGRTIGAVAHLPDDALARLTDEDAAARGVRAAQAVGGSARPAHAAAQAVLDDALALTLTLDAPALDGTLRRAAASLGVATFTEHVVAPMLRRVGHEWHAGRLTIAQEHLASAAVHDILVETMRSLARGNGAARVVVATPSGERHAIGAALAGAAAAADGWDVIYLGADLPAGEIAAAAATTGARLVALSVVYVADREGTLAELRTLRARLPAERTLLVGGAGASELRAELSAAGIRVAESLDELRGALHDALHDAGVGAS
jgi:methanogenic corrinoid protein MtbC1